MKPNRLQTTVGASLLAATMGGCSTVQVGEDFDLSAFASRVEQGQTTQANVQQWLGPPTGTGIAVEGDGQRYEEWNYYYGSGRLPRLSDPQFKLLRIRFDREGRVHSYSWSDPADGGAAKR